MRPFSLKIIKFFTGCDHNCSFDFGESMGLDQRFELNGSVIPSSHKSGHRQFPIFNLLFHMMDGGNQVALIWSSPQSVCGLVLVGGKRSI